MKHPILLAGSLLFSAGATAQTTYTQTLPTMYGVYSWTTFEFTGCPPTTGPGSLDLYWACCWMSGFGGNSISIEFETSVGWEQVFAAGGNYTECTFLPGSGTVDPSILSDAIDFGGGTIHGRLYATDNCVAGWGCSGFSDPAVSGLTLTYEAHEANFSVSDAGICPGGTIQFTDESINTPASYEWIFEGGDPSTSGIQNPVVQYNTPGSWDVTLIVVTADGPDTLLRPDYITVFPLPLANAGVDEGMCAGSAAQLQASGGTSYQWFPPDDLNNANIANPMASPEDNTVYTVLVTDANGCQASDYMILTVHALPNVVASAGNNTICLGDTAYVVAVGAQLYQWSPNLFISGTSGAAQYVWPTSTFTWTVTGTDLYGCVNDTTVTITVEPPPPAPTITPNGAELQSSPGVTYQWYLNGSLLAGANGSIYVPTQNGNYTVEITDANGCSAMSLPYFMANVGVESIEEETFTVFPSPASDLLWLRGPAASVAVTLADARGAIVLRKELDASREHGIDLGSLAAGSYLLELVWGGHVQRATVVKE